MHYCGFEGHTSSLNSIFNKLRHWSLMMKQVKYKHPIKEWGKPMQLINCINDLTYTVQQSYRNKSYNNLDLAFSKALGGNTPDMLLDITEKGNPTEHPVFRGLGRPEVHSRNVVQVRSNWLLIDGTGVKPRIS